MSSGRLVRVVVAGMLAALTLSACSAATSGRGTAAGGVTSPAPHPVTQPAAPPSAAPADRPVAPARTPCTANARRQWVLVSLRRQHLWMCDRHRVVRDTAITSGMLGAYTETPTGNFRIQGLDRNSTLTLITGATYQVKYWIPFDAPLFGFHDAPWQRFAYGSPAYKTRGSHGCVHMPLSAIRFLYRWAEVGTPVRIKR